MLMDYFKKMKKEKRVYDSDSYTRTAIPETKQKESRPVSSLPGILIDRPVNQLKFTRTGSVSSTSNLFHPCKPILEILPFSIYTMPCGIRILNGIKPVSTIVTKTNGRVEADTGCHDDLALATSCVHYVRKYDPPMLIDTQEFSTFSNDMSNIIAGNSARPGEFTNEGLMRHIKENIGEMGGFVDILGLYEQH